MKVPVALGAVATLEKPFKQGDLLAMVDKSLGKQRDDEAKGDAVLIGPKKRGRRPWPECHP